MAPGAGSSDNGPMSDAGSIYDLEYTDNTGRTVSLAEFTGRPILIVNTASRCGFTPQYEGLQRLHEQFADRGLAIVGFPCDQFAHQEPGDDAEIAAFCSTTYGVTFPLSTKVEVNGPRTHPVFTFLKRRSRSLLGSTVKWNFTKFLISPDGQTVQRFSPNTRPDQLSTQIESMLSPAA